jgi:eukaryotic-like serine/threonine-protein kinase
MANDDPGKPKTGNTPRLPSDTLARGVTQTPAPEMTGSPSQRQAVLARQSSPPQPVTSTQPRAEGGDPYIGTTIADRYKVLSKLGEGGMGVVYLAEHVFIEKKVAVKILSEDFARKGDLVARFMQEAKAASKIGHENIIDITDFGETATGSVFFVMEFLDGRDLAHHIRDEGSMSLPRVRYIMNQLCRALGAAHTKGIIHRDLKPENIYLIEREGRIDFVKVLDFGIAKVSSLDEGGSRLTRTGMIFGTPEYMSPEQARGDRPDHRVDIYAAGCILYEMLTGDVPFHAETFMGVLTKHMFEAPEPPTVRAPQAGISPELEAVVLKALHKDRDQRFQSMKEMALALEQSAGGDPENAWGNEGSGIMTNIEPKGESSQRVRTHRPQTAQRVAAQPQTSTEPPVPPKSKTPLVFGVLVALGLAGGGAWFVLHKNPPPVVVETPKPKVEEPKVEAPKVEAPVVVPPSDISITSTPSEADIFNGPEKLGTTPAKLSFKADTAPFEVTIRKKGFKDQKLRIVPDHSREYVLDLQSSRSSSSSSKPTSKPTSKPAVGETTKPKVEEVKPEVKPAGKLRDLKDPFAN